MTQDAPPPRSRLYRDGRVIAEDVTVETAAQRLEQDPGAVLWLDLSDASPADLSSLAAQFGLHPLAAEDAATDHQRPRLDRYGDQLFLDMYAVSFDPATTALATSEISAFVLPRALLTLHGPDFDVDALQARWDTTAELEGMLAENALGLLVHGLLDLVVDGHYTAVQAMEDAVDDLEDAVFEPGRSTDVRRGGFGLRKSLVQLRRVVQPMRELVERLLRSDLPLAQGRLEPYYRDVHDHVLHAADAVDSARDLLTGVLSTALEEQGNDLNVITRKLAAWAAIIAVPTAVTGFYGQNVPYPGFQHSSGFAASTVVIAVLSLGLYVQLRRRGWL